MLGSLSLAVVLPAYNAEHTLEAVIRTLPPEVDFKILGDDASRDGTVAKARALGLQVHVHARNQGYGANQKTCYQAALAAGADLVVMLHPDGQYPPTGVLGLAEKLVEGADVVLGSRFLEGVPLSGGMPPYKYLSNRALTAFQNLLLQQNLSEYHTGFRAFRRSALEKLPFAQNHDGFLFDNQILLQAHQAGLRIAEVPCSTHYGPESSSIRPLPALLYGLGVVTETLRYKRAPARWRPSR